MTATTTSKNNRRGGFALRFRSKLSEGTKLFITNLFFNLLSLPLLILGLRSLYLDQHEIRYSDSDITPFIAIVFIASLLCMVLGIVIPMVIFRYLYNKSLVDMNYSLPLTNRQRFFADFFAGLTLFIIPMLIGALISGAELLIGGLFFVDLYKYAGFIPLLLRIGSVILIGMILLYTFSVLAINFAGNMLEAIFSIVALNIMVPAFLFLTWMNIVNAANYGLTYDSATVNYLLPTTSPIGVLCCLFSEQAGLLNSYSWRYSSYYSSALPGAVYLNFCIRALLFTAAVIFITYLLYRHRKPEDVSKPYVYKAFYYAIMGLAVYCIVSLLQSFNISFPLAVALIISGIFWFVTEVIRRRGFKRFWTAVIGFASVSAIVIGVIKVIDATNGLGRAKYIPSASSVSEVKIYVGQSSLSPYATMYKISHDPEIINDVMELNREILDRRFKPDNYDYELFYDKGGNNHQYMAVDDNLIEISYYTKSGATIFRKYMIPSEMLTELLCDFYTSSEYAENFSNKLYLHNLDDSTIYDRDKSDQYIFRLIYKNGQYRIIYLSDEEGKQLIDALKADIIAMTPEDLKASEFYCEFCGYAITSACRNTVSFFEEHHIEYSRPLAKMIGDINTDDDKVMTMRVDPLYTFPLDYYKPPKNFNYRFLFNYHYFFSYSGRYVKLDSIFNFNVGRNNFSVIDKENTYTLTQDDIGYAAELLDIATPLITGEKIIAQLETSKTNTLYIKDSPENREIINNAIESRKLHSTETDTAEDNSDF